MTVSGHLVIFDIVDEEGFKTLEPCQNVEFEISKGDKGMKALKVKKV
jgi:cold shock CspA family protein